MGKHPAASAYLLEHQWLAAHGMCLRHRWAIASVRIHQARITQLRAAEVDLGIADRIAAGALADPARTVLDLPFVVALTPQHPAFVYQRVPDPDWG